ncbi:hypothetical protein C8R47DRAFT_1138588 [Mycena vitilis]|nr:hypothetical protein C8R47DRAFT_1138588 [Mycena vitilis]
MAPSHLISLPTELLFIILDFLCETNQVPSIECGVEQATISTRHLHALSSVCRYLRRSCLSRLFSRLKITHTEPLRLLGAKCAVNPAFASLIRRLDLTHVESPEEKQDRRKRNGLVSSHRDRAGLESEKPYRYGPEILPTLLPLLKSLEWLDLAANQIDSDLLNTLNSHPSLATVAVCDTHLYTLRTLFSSTSLPLSKIRVHSALTNISFKLQSPALQSWVNRRLRITHLILHDEPNIRAGPGMMLLPGLETLHIALRTKPTSTMTWLPDFVDRHPGLRRIEFSGRGLVWSGNPDIIFPLQFREAVERQSLARTVDIAAFSVSRTRSATSLDDWPVVHLELLIEKGVGVAAMSIAQCMAPQLSSLIIRMSRFIRQPVRADNLISSLCRTPSLRTLELHCVSKHLSFEGQTSPWAVKPCDHIKPTSNCTDAHSAMHWVAVRVAQSLSSLDLIHIVDEGCDSLNGRVHDRWSLEVTYRVRENRGLEIYGTPKFAAAKRFRLREPNSSG